MHSVWIQDSGYRVQGFTGCLDNLYWVDRRVRSSCFGFGVSETDVGMFVCMFVCMYVCMQVCMYEGMCVYSKTEKHT